MTPSRPRIRYVDGARIRDRHVGFALGGHGYVYDWIPKSEVWVEKILKGCDRKATVVHELAEREAMKRGMHYEAAHRLANGAERIFRRGCRR